MSDIDRKKDAETRIAYEPPLLTRHKKLVDITMYTLPEVTVTP